MSAKERLIGAILVSTTITLPACSSIISKPDSGASVSDGIVYYMPRRPIKITATFDKDGNPSASVDPGDTIADPSRRFMLDYSENFVGTNHMNITVNSQGLLEGSNADTTSGIDTIVKNIATAMGQITALAKPAAPPVGPLVKAGPAVGCQPNESYTVLLFPEDKQGSICKISIKIERALLTGEVPAPTPNPNARVANASSHSGVFYRTDVAYRVTLTDLNLQTHDFLAYSPDESPIFFVPVTKTLFSNNKTNITITDGTLKSIDQSSDGELVALSQLPSDAISAYLTAVGSVFSSLGSNVADQKTLISNQESLSVAQIKKQACLSSIAANDLKNKTGTDLSAAVSNVVAACQ